MEHAMSIRSITTSDDFGQLWQHIYIPQSERQAWGTSTNIRGQLEDRNEEIVYRYKSGITISQLVEIYHLSEDRIRRIIYDHQK